MFTKCRACDHPPEDCAMKLLLLPFPEFVAWLNKFKKDYSVSNQKIADWCATPVGTIGRIAAGDEDCKFSTFQAISISVLEKMRAEFPCPEFVPTVQHLELLEQQAAKLASVEKENEALKEKLDKIDEIHRSDILAVREEHKKQIDDKNEQIAFLKEQLKAWQSR